MSVFINDASNNVYFIVLQFIHDIVRICRKVYQAILVEFIHVGLGCKLNVLPIDIAGCLGLECLFERFIERGYCNIHWMQCRPVCAIATDKLRLETVNFLESRNVPFRYKFTLALFFKFPTFSVM